MIRTWLQPYLHICKFWDYWNFISLYSFWGSIRYLQSLTITGCDRFHKFAWKFKPPGLVYALAFFTAQCAKHIFYTRLASLIYLLSFSTLIYKQFPALARLMASDCFQSMTFSFAVRQVVKLEAIFRWNTMSRECALSSNLVQSLFTCFCSDGAVCTQWQLKIRYWHILILLGSFISFYLTMTTHKNRNSLVNIQYVSTLKTFSRINLVIFQDSSYWFQAFVLIAY